MAWTKLNDLQLIKSVLDASRKHGLKQGDQLGLAIARLTQSFAAPTAAQIRAAIPDSFSNANPQSKGKAVSLVQDVLSKHPRVEIQQEETEVGVEIVAITALNLEAKAVLSLLENIEQVTHPQTSTVYYVGEARVGEQRRRVAVVVGGEGNSNAAAETERALTFLKPRVVLFVGVAGGLKDELQLGDVVIGSHVYDYASAKDGRDFIQSRIKTLPASYAIGQRANAVILSRSWESYLPSAPTPPRAYFKPIAAGPRLLQSTESDMAVWIKAHCGDALAVEMEGFGFLQAGLAHPTTQALVVRGISDLVDDKNANTDSAWQPVAAQRAAAFALTTAFEYLDNSGPQSTEKKGSQR